jgi:hypothetical protein
VSPHAPAGDVAKGRLLSARREDDRTVRHVLGLRAAAFLTAGIARVPFWKFILADASGAIVGVPFSFGLAYFFTDPDRGYSGRCTSSRAMAAAPRAPSVERTGDRQHRPVESPRPQDRVRSARPRGDSAMARSGPSEENLASGQ